LRLLLCAPANEKIKRSGSGETSTQIDASVLLVAGGLPDDMSYPDIFETGEPITYTAFVAKLTEEHGLPTATSEPANARVALNRFGQVQFGCYDEARGRTIIFVLGGSPSAPSGGNVVGVMYDTADHTVTMFDSASNSMPQIHFSAPPRTLASRTPPARRRVRRHSNFSRTPRSRLWAAEACAL
jgi:hypothetical protein